MDRREFLIAIGGLALSSLVRANEGLEVVVNVDSSDVIGKDFAANRELGELGWAAEKVSSYSADYGVPLSFSFREGGITRAELEDKMPGSPINIFYTSMEKIKSYFLEKPERFIHETQGEEWLEDNKRRNEELVKRLGWNNSFGVTEFMNRDDFEMIWGEFDISSKGGLGSRYSRRIYIPEIKIPMGRVNYLAFVIAHEIGHVFKLEHNAEEEPNLMNLDSLLNLERKTTEEKLGQLITGPIPPILTWERWGE